MDAALFYQNLRGSVICVNHGLWTHKGFVHSVEFRDGAWIVWIIDNSQGRGSVGYQTLEQFANGKPVWIERPARSWFEANAIIARAEAHLQRPYDLLLFNCEHLVTAALGLEAESGQLQALGAVCLGIAGLVMLVAGSSRSGLRAA
jgi:hypothetical protein